MRDGVELVTNLYLPYPEARHLPCILIRSPAGLVGFWKNFLPIAKQGYVVAVQETRSALDKEGKSLPFVADGWGRLKDGYDTVEWLAKSPYTNGEIGTWGVSALGITELLLAPTKPEHLKAQYVVFAAASLYHHGIFPGGQFLKHQAESWLGLYARDSGVISYVSQHPFYNAFWKQLNSLEVCQEVNVPAIHIGGWYDTFLDGTLSSFTTRQLKGCEGAFGKQKLVIGPWTHFWPDSKKLGDFEIPANGMNPPYDISPKRWFDHYLKGVDNGVEKLPNVIYYVMGPFDGSASSGNVWKTAEEWPVPSKPLTLYLGENKKLSYSPGKDFVLSYDYNPENPVPTLGGRNLFLESGPKDQRAIEKREDVLVFTSDKLSEDLEVTGSLSATLYFASDRKDTDLVVRLCDVYPDGRSLLVSEGGIRTGVLNVKATESKPIQKIDIDLSSTSIVFAKDHAIRLIVTSSSYPRYEKNMNLGILGSHGRGQIATNKVYTGKGHPSYLLLPIVKNVEKSGLSAPSNSNKD